MTEYTRLPANRNDLMFSLSQPTLITSFDAGSGATGTATSTTIDNLDPYSDVQVYVNVTVSTGVTTNTLILLVDSKLDGTNWANIARFVDIVAVGTHIGHFTRRNSNAGTVMTSDAGAGSFRAVGIGRNIRIRRQIIGTATTKFTAEIYVSALLI